MNEIVPEGPDEEPELAVVLAPLLQAARARQAAADRTAKRRYRCLCTGVLSKLLVDRRWPMTGKSRNYLLNGLG
jgi:hypothetical protein